MSRWIPFVLATALAGGCAARVTYRAGVTATTPDLVYVSPGVQVIADYDEPIFFANGYYWWYAGDGWYRSSYYTGGWVYVVSPPSVVVRIDRPHVYRHYRPAGYVVRHRPVPIIRVKRPPPRGVVVRDHRR